MSEYQHGFLSCEQDLDGIMAHEKPDDLNALYGPDTSAVIGLGSCEKIQVQHLVNALFIEWKNHVLPTIENSNHEVRGQLRFQTISFLIEPGVYPDRIKDLVRNGADAWQWVQLFRLGISQAKDMINTHQDWFLI